MTPRKVFVREATGLVKTASMFDVFNYNVAGMGMLGSAVFFASWGYIFNGGDFFTLWWVSMVATVFICLTYYFVAVSMPRAGADYVFQSRILHPAIGFIAAGFTGWLAAVANIGYGATAWIASGIGPLLSYASFATNNPSLQDLAVVVTSPQASTTIGVLTILAFGLVLGLGGTKKFLRITNVLMLISFVLLGLMIYVTATTTHGQFVDAFNSVTESYGTSYSDVIAKATQTGWSPPPATPAQALFVVPFVLSCTWWATQSVALSGETKEIKKSQFGALLLAPLVCITVFMIAYVGLVSMVGYDFATAMGYFAFTNPSAVSIPVLLPFPAVFYYGLASKNLLLTALIAISPMVALLPMTGWGIIIFSRYIFATSFDRILPDSFSNVSDRFHTPMVSIVVASVLSIAVMVGLQFVSGFYPSAASYVWYIGVSANVFVQIVAFISALALALFPYLKRQTYDQVFPFKRRIGGVPIVTWSGIATMLILLYSLDVWFLQPFSALVFGGYPELAYVVVIWAVVLVVIYGIAKAYRKRQGIDLGLVFKEIPPE